ncbi:MAG TPA: ABC transporter permease [Alphaproteobacteria bacterium]|nr:ABC transporter permease [Alphaproteobacteria bacterium]
MATGIMQDLRYGLRQLRKSPGFAITAVLTLALGIAVNATMFSLVSAFLLPRLPGRDPQRVVVVSAISPDQGFQPDAHPVSAPNYLAWRKTNHVFADMAAAEEYRTVSLAGHGQPESLPSAAVSSNYFNVLGVSPQLGRAFADGEDQPGSDHVVILSHSLWERRFGSDPSIVGQTVRLNRENYIVIGVMAADFRLLGFTPQQLWTPLVLSATDQTPAARKHRSLHLFARLAPGVTLAQARAELNNLARQAENDFPETEKHWGATVRTLADFLSYDFGIRTALAVLMTTVGFVLLLACANVTGLLLARATGRQKELALRISLGASRKRIVRQLLTESLVLAFLGGGLGLLFSYWGIGVLRANMAFNEAVSSIPLGLDSNVLLFALGVSLVSAVLSGLVPAIKASQADTNTDLKSEGRATSIGRSHSRLRTVLVGGEIAFALFLLIGTGLLIRGIFLIEHQNLGFEADHLLTASLALDKARYKDADQQSLFVGNLISALQQIHGVEAVAAATDLPASGADSVPIRIKDQPDLPGSQERTALDVVVTTDYFRAAGIPLLRGRTFTERDDAAAGRVVIINQEFVHRYFHDQDPIGKQIQLEVKGSVQWSEVVGVAGGVKSYSESSRDDPEVYEPFLQRPISGFSVMLRASSEPNGLAADLRHAVAQIDPELPLARVMTMVAVVENQRNGNPLFMRMLGTFALLALILAAIGVYGLIAYSVGQRTHEIGIRMALGARGSDVLRMILREGVKMTAIGSAVGLVMALPLPKVFEAIFVGLRLREPGLYVFVLAVMLMVTALATYIPARRATRVQPMSALRDE